MLHGKKNSSSNGTDPTSSSPTTTSMSSLSLTKNTLQNNGNKSSSPTTPSSASSTSTSTSISRSSVYSPKKSVRTSESIIHSNDRVASDSMDVSFTSKPSSTLGLPEKKKEAPTPSSSPLPPRSTHECCICTDSIEIYSIGECNHRVCHICSLRLRALYKSNQCPYCKTNVPQVVMTANPNKSFQDFLPLTKLPYHDSGLHVYYDSAKAHGLSMDVLKKGCSYPGCGFIARHKDWHTLRHHVKNEHHLHFCDICIEHKKVFPREHTLYLKHLLSVHCAKGDASILDKVVRPDSSFTQGHPYCEFCKQWYFSSDELYAHCKRDHEECFLCQRQNILHMYYINYASLENHFAKDHFMCKQPSCLEKKFVVFANSMDLQVHMVMEHPKVVGPRCKIDIEPTFRTTPLTSYLPSSSSHFSNSTTTSSSSSASSLHNHVPPVLSPSPGFGRLTQPPPPSVPSSSSSSTSSSSSAASPTTHPTLEHTTLNNLLGNDVTLFQEFLKLSRAMLQNTLGPNDFLKKVCQLVKKKPTDPLLRKIVETCPDLKMKRTLLALIESKQVSHGSDTSTIWTSTGALIRAGPVPRASSSSASVNRTPSTPPRLSIVDSPSSSSSATSSSSSQPRPKSTSRLSILSTRSNPSSSSRTKSSTTTSGSSTTWSSMLSVHLPTSRTDGLVLVKPRSSTASSSSSSSSLQPNNQAPEFFNVSSTGRAWGSAKKHSNSTISLPSSSTPSKKGPPTSTPSLHASQPPSSSSTPSKKGPSKSTPPSNSAHPPAPSSSSPSSSSTFSSSNSSSTAEASNTKKSKNMKKKERVVLFHTG
ncbi:hypothetical protein HMI55_006291 [Coelomomyces lativittatus]|nr:hypothetical protein HMI55_006291 [Coelomomyces lativittatus]